METFINIITSDICLGIFATAIVTGIIILIRKNKKFKETFDIIHETAKVVEENIPDNTTNAKLSLLDKFLKLFIKKYKEEVKANQLETSDKN